MIEIVTLLVGLMAGEMTVDLRVDPAVRAVEVRVDGQPIHRMEEPPWGFQVDWGSEIRPRELEVVAFDGEGRELDRDRGWINLHASQAKAQIVFAPPGKKGRIPHFGLRWRTVGIRTPESVVAHFDEKKLDIDQTGQILLPDYDPDELHWLSVEVDFGAAGKEVLGASVGGENLFELDTELTPVAVEVESRLGGPDLGGLFRIDDEPLTVHGVEKGPIEVLMVCDPAAVRNLLVLSRAARVGSNTIRGSGIRRSLPGTLTQSFSLGEIDADAEVTAWDLYTRDPGISEFGRLGENTTLRFLWPQTASWRGSVLSPETFHQSPAQPMAGTGLLASTYRQSPPQMPNQVAPAVAMAGLVASSSSRRRAVVLVGENLGTEDPRYIAMVVRYLQALRVPLYVWTVGANPDPGAWPNALHLGDLDNEIRTRNNLGDAIKDLRFDLRRQRIVWLEGRWLPQDISFVPGTEGVRWPSSEEY